MKNKKSKKFFLAVFFVGIFFAIAFFSIYVAENSLAVPSAEYVIPGVSISADPANEGIVRCGRPSQTGMCSLCDLIKGFNTIIQYIIKIAIGVALLAMAVGGVLYIVSAGESAMMEHAKSAMKNAAIGFVIVLAAYLIINTTITWISASDNNLGMKTATKWGEFDCAATGK